MAAAMAVEVMVVAAEVSAHMYSVMPHSPPIACYCKSSALALHLSPALCPHCSLSVFSTINHTLVTRSFHHSHTLTLLLIITTRVSTSSGYGDIELHISVPPLYISMFSISFSTPNATVSRSQNPLVITEFHSVHVAVNVSSGSSSKLLHYNTTIPSQPRLNHQLIHCPT